MTKTRQPRSPLPAILLLAFAVRVAWLLTQTAVMENEGAAYARLAENLFWGDRYVGIIAGSELLFAPFYPVLIAAVSCVTGEFELAGRFVSLAMGTLLVVPVFLLASRLYGRRVALLCVVLAALHPLLIGLSTVVLSEGTFATLLMSGAWFGLRCVERPTPRHGLLAGLFFGLAYITRAEALVYPVLVVAATLGLAALRRAGLRHAVVASVLLVTTFLPLASPYIALLTWQTGHLRVEGQGIAVYAIGRRMRAGMPYGEAAYGVSPDLKDQGPMLDPTRAVAEPVYPEAPGPMLRYFLAGAKDSAKTLGDVLITSFALGSPLLIGLVFLGLVGSPWGRERAIQEAFLLSMFALLFGTRLGLQHFWYRYAFPFVPFLLLWTAKGVDELANWVATTAAATVETLAAQRTQIGGVVRWGLAGVLVLWTAGGVVKERTFFESTVEFLPEKQAGVWLAHYLPGPKTVMSTGTVVPYYAHASWVPSPVTDGATAVKYIRQVRPDFMALVARQGAWHGYETQWVETGMPGGDFEVIHEETVPGKRVVIYRVGK